MHTLFDVPTPRRVLWRSAVSFQCSDPQEMEVWLKCSGFTAIASPPNPHESARYRDQYGSIVVFYRSGTGLIQGNPDKTEETKFLITAWEKEE